MIFIKNDFNGGYDEASNNLKNNNFRAFKYTLPERNYLHILQFRISRICL